ncbi:MAG TPA: hypothetical protein VEV16_11795 [Daejeonella sp.]|nr:hypothetical protein [Daejeonella sp.]
MKRKLALLALSIIILASCKKNELNLTPQSVKYSKIESFFTPFDYGKRQLDPSKKFLFTSQSFNSSGDLILSFHRVLDYQDVDTTFNILVKTTYKYENGRLVEKNVLRDKGLVISPMDDRLTFTYTHEGDTAEVKRYNNKTGKLGMRFTYTYGNNGMKSRITYYSSLDGYSADSEDSSDFFKYDNKKNIIERSSIVAGRENPYKTIQYSYNSKNHLIEAGIPGIYPSYEGQYTYDEKGRITEYIRKDNPYSAFYKIYRFVNSYNSNGLLSKKAFYTNSDLLVGVEEYVYTK